MKKVLKTQWKLNRTRILTYFQTGYFLLNLNFARLGWCLKSESLAIVEAAPFLHVECHPCSHPTSRQNTAWQCLSSFIRCIFSAPTDRWLNAEIKPGKACSHSQGSRIRSVRILFFFERYVRTLMYYILAYSYPRAFGHSSLMWISGSHPKHVASSHGAQRSKGISLQPPIYYLPAPPKSDKPNLCHHFTICMVIT